MAVCFVQILLPKIEPLSEQQRADIFNLGESSQQAEDALSQGMDKLQQTLALSITSEPLNGETYGSQMVAAVESLEALESFVNQVMDIRLATSMYLNQFYLKHTSLR